MASALHMKSLLVAAMSLVIVFNVTGCGNQDSLASETGQVENINFKHNGKDRAAELYMCQGCRGKLVPLVMAFPGTNQNIKGWNRFSKWHVDAEQHEFAVLTFERADIQEYKENFDVAKKIGDTTMSYIKKVLTQVKGLHPKLFENGGDLFCVGFSRGGRLCSHLPSQLEETEYKFRAIAPIASVQFPGYDGSQPPAAASPPPYKLAVIAVHQTGDSTNHYNRGFGGYGGCDDCKVSKAIDMWKAHNGCKQRKESKLDDSAWGGLPTAREDHTQCTEGADVTLVTLTGQFPGSDPAGHSYPNDKKESTSITTKTVWTFFDGHRSQS